MWGGLDEALGVRVQPNAPSSTPPTRDEAATASGTQPAPKRAPFNLFDFFGGLDAALGVSVNPKQPSPSAGAAAQVLHVTPAPTQTLRSVFQPGRTVDNTEPPLVVLVHGLESHSGTWDALMSRFAASKEPSPSFLAVDLRGHGLTPVGEELDFGPATLARDVMACVTAHNASAEKFILVGHSMGARVATRLVADFPNKVSHLVIEDMDARQFDGTKYFGEQWRVNGFEYVKARGFCQSGESIHEVASALVGAAGPGTFQKDRVDGYVARGRVFAAPNGRGFSLIHPLGFALACDTVLVSDDMQLALEKIAVTQGLRDRLDRSNHDVCSIHLWRAPELSGQSSAALAPGEKGGVAWILATIGEHNIHDTVFPNSGHSVHNDAQEAYENALRLLAFTGTPATFEQ